MEVENSGSEMESNLKFKSTSGKFFFICLAPTESLEVVIMSVCPSAICSLKVCSISNKRRIFTRRGKCHMRSLNTSVLFFEGIYYTGCPKKNVPMFESAITPAKKALELKVGWVLKNSGNSLSDEH